MEIIVEFILEIVFESLFYVGTDKKRSKWIRYPIIFLFFVIYLLLITVIAYLAVLGFEKNIFIGMLLIIIDVVIIVATISKFKKEYRKLNKS